MSGALGDWDDVLEQPADEPQEDGEKPWKFALPNLPAFLDVLFDIYPQRVQDNSILWCPEWWEHPEAVYRLTQTWHAWESASRHTGALASWMRDVADYHLPIVLHPQGPFFGCTMDHHEAQPPQRERLSFLYPPPGLFLDHETHTHPKH